MQTEHDRLKESADRQYSKERHEEVLAYLDSLDKEIGELFIKGKKGIWIELAAALTWVVTSFSSQEYLYFVAFWVWLFTIIYRNHTVQMPLSRKMGEMKGSLQTLHLLGFLPEGPDDHQKKKKLKPEKVSWYESMWNAIKSKKRNEAIV